MPFSCSRDPPPRPEPDPRSVCTPANRRGHPSRFRRAATQLAYIRRSHLFTLSKNIAGDPKGSRFTDRKPDPGIPFRRTRPKPSRFLHRTALRGLFPGQARQMVGPGGLEPPTSRLSGVCSNQLSYKPHSKLILFYSMTEIYLRFFLPEVKITFPAAVAKIV